MEGLEVTVQQRVERLERTGRLHRRLVGLVLGVLGLALLTGQGKDEPLVRAEEIDADAVRVQELWVRTPGRSGEISVRVEARSGLPSLSLRAHSVKTRSRLGSQGFQFENPHGFKTVTLGWGGGIQFSPPGIQDGRDRRCAYLQADTHGQRELAMVSAKGWVTLLVRPSHQTQLRLDVPGVEGSWIAASVTQTETSLEHGTGKDRK